MNELLKCIFRGTVLFLEEDVDICTERVKDFLLAAADICIPTFQRRIQGEGWGVARPPSPWEVFEHVLLQLDDEEEGILGEGHFISQIPWKWGKYLENTLAVNR